MSYSKAQIFNITLNILGISTPLENADCDDNRAILLNNYYDLAKDYVLRDFDWNFASTFKKLSKVPSNNFFTKYKFIYDYPNDCIFARDLFSSDNYELKTFAISSLNDGSKIILTDVENANLRYTRRVDKEIFYSPEFSMALAHYLASLTSNVLSGSIQKGEIAFQKYNKLIKHAKVINATEGENELYSDETYLDSRG